MLPNFKLSLARSSLSGSWASPADNTTKIMVENVSALLADQLSRNGVFNSSASCFFNGTLNTTQCQENSPSSLGSASLPHSLWLTIFLGILATVVSLITILGNITVLLAFGLERTIRQPTNYFLASLAVSDLLIGTFSMPLYTQYLLWGSWVLGPWLCDIWLSLDWTVCLTSQYTVFLITMDRFLSVKIPAKYRNWRSERKVLIMISITWILPALVFFTSIIGWQYFVGERTVKPQNCEVQFMEDPKFTFLLTIGYYWITLFVMCVLYGGIYKVALDLQRKSDEKQKKLHTTMEMAGENSKAAIRSLDDDKDKGTNNNTAGGHRSAKQKSQNKSKSRKSKKSVKSVLPCPPGLQAVNTTSFGAGQGVDKDDERSSSPAFGSDEDNSSSGGAGGSGKAAKNSGAQSGKANHSGGAVNSVIFTNTGGLVRSLHKDLFFTASATAQLTESYRNHLQPHSPPLCQSGHPSEFEQNPAPEQDSVYSSSASDRLEKQTTPLLPHEVRRGCRFIDEKSLLATLSSENAALIPVTGEYERDDSDMNDFHTSPIWKRRSSLPPLASDVFELDDEAGECFMTTELNASSELPVLSASPLSIAYRYLSQDQRPLTDTVNTQASLTTAADLATDDSSGRKSSQMTNTEDAAGQYNNNCLNSPPSDTNTNEDSSRSDIQCLAAVRRRNKDTRLHSFVKSVRCRNSRRRNRRERKSKSENRARKALRTISFILGAFVLCWTPYHVALMVFALCKDCVDLRLYSFSYWLCYLNSPINPFCYAFANAQFKRTFLRIMRFDWHRT